MAPKQFRLSGPTMQGLRSRVLAEHGPYARIIAAEKVRVGGVWGFFAREHYEVTVEVNQRSRRGVHALLQTPPPSAAASAGIDALIDNADGAEFELAAAAAPRLSVSTGSNDFAELMDDLTFNTSLALEGPAAEGPPASPSVFASATSSSAPSSFAPGTAGNMPRPSAATSSSSALPPTPPAPSEIAGDLVAVVGLGEDPWDVVHSMSTVMGTSATATAGAVSIKGAEHVADARAAAAIRAAGVTGGYSTLVAFGLGTAASDVPENAAALHAIAPDQVWVAVDAGRKPMDTALWVNAVRTAVPVRAMAVLRAGSTASPETVNALGLPMGWLDGTRATSTVL